VYFVTRMKDNAQFEVVEEHTTPQHRNILKDQTIRLTGTGAQEKCPYLLRRVEAVREDTGETLTFLTNHLGLGASTIAAIYKDRWQIELFFKALKQNEDQDLRWHLGQRGQDTDMDSIDLDVATALSATVLPFRMEPVQSGRTVAHESVYPPRPDGLAQPAIRNTTRSAGPPPSNPGV